MQKYLSRSAPTRTPATSSSPPASVSSTPSVVSDGSDSPEHEAPPSVRPTTSHCCIFDIDRSILWYENKLLRNVEYRPRHRRVLHTRAKISWIYKHGADLQADGVPKMWLCRICHLRRNIKSQLFVGTATTSAAEHLKNMHNIWESEEDQKSAGNKTSRPSSSITPQPFNDLLYKSRLIDWVILHDIPFHIPCAVDSRTLFAIDSYKEIEAILPTSDTTLGQWVRDSFTQRWPRIRDHILLAKSKLNFSIDGWKSPNRDNYVAAVTHFIDQDGELIHALLGFRKLDGPKSGCNIAKVVKDIFERYGIQSKKLGAFMMDNAGENDKMIEELSKHYSIKIERQRLRCLGHIINLVVKAMLFGKGVSKLERALAGASIEDAFKIWHQQGPIGRLHNIIVYILRSSNREDEFKICQAAVASPDETLVYYTLLLDGGIRWNSTADMIERALRLRNAIDLYQSRWKKARLDEYDLSQDFLNDADWKALERWLELLEGFRALCKTEESLAKQAGREGQYGVLSGVIKGMSFMHDLLKDAQDSLDDLIPEEHQEYYNAGINTAFQKVDKYYKLTDKSPLYAAAIILHPAYRFDWFEDKWVRYGQQKWIKPVKDKFRKLYDEYLAAYIEEQQDKMEVTIPIESDSENEGQEQDISTNGKRRNPYLEYTRISASYAAKRRKRIDQAARIEDYTKFFRPPFNQEDAERIKDPLNWWRQHELDYPVLSQLAYDVFSIPGMSAEAERVFSDAKKLITDERNKLTPSTVEACECQKHWIKNRLV